MQHATAVRRLALLALVPLGGIMTAMPAPAAASRCVPSGSNGSSAVPTAKTLLGVGVEVGIPVRPAPTSGATYAADLGSVRP